MWEKLLEASSTLESLRNKTPSDRSDVSGTEGTWEFDKPNNPEPWKDKKIWGNLNNQSRGMEGELDTQGKNAPEMFASNQGSVNKNTRGTYTPNEYKKLYAIKESANGAANTGVNSAKHKGNGIGSPWQKRVSGGDTRPGGSCNCGRSRPMTESQLLGSTMALLASHVLTNQSFGGLVNK